MKPQVFRAIRLAVFIGFSVFLIQTTAAAVTYQHAIELRKMTFSWSIVGEKLYVKLTGNTRGWVGIGFNPTRRMKDADFVLGYVKNGKAMVTDAFGVRAREHIDDTAMQGTDNVSNISGSEISRTTTIEFAIPLDSGDRADTRLDSNGFTTVLLAYGRGRDNFQDRHRYRTTLRVNLATGQYKR